MRTWFFTAVNAVTLQKTSITPIILERLKLVNLPKFSISTIDILDTDILIYFMYNPSQTSNPYNLSLEQENGFQSLKTETFENFKCGTPVT